MVSRSFTELFLLGNGNLVFSQNWLKARLSMVLGCFCAWISYLHPQGVPYSSSVVNTWDAFVSSGTVLPEGLMECGTQQPLGEKHGLGPPGVTPSWVEKCWVLQNVPLLCSAHSYHLQPSLKMNWSYDNSGPISWVFIDGLFLALSKFWLSWLSF
jgi:hypothetical protein